MSDKTKIEWSDATWNPVTGCSKVSEGCRHCYAMTFAERWRGTPGHYFEKGFDIVLRPNKLDQPLRWTKARKIFVNSMSDLFHKEITDEFIDQVFAIMSLAPQHTFQLLTKRPERMAQYLNTPGRDEQIGHMAFELYEIFGGHGDCSLAAGLVHGPGRATNLPGVPERPIAWPLPNVWLGVSVENQKAADERIPLLLNTPATVRFLSCEPLLGPVDIRQWTCKEGMECRKSEWLLHHYCPDNRIDWVIVGGESGTGARPMHPEWAFNLRDQCQEAGIHYFFKQWGEWAPVHDLCVNEPGIKGKKWFTWDPDTSVCRIGKEAAGRLLDGRTWDEYPETIYVSATD